jgi:hypothetical protein
MWPLGPGPYEIIPISKQKTLANFLWTLGVRLGWPRPAGPKKYTQFSGDGPKELLINDFVLEFASDFKHKIFNEKFLGLIS